MAGPASCARDFGQESRHFLRDDLARLARCQFALLPIFVDQLLQVIDRKEIDILQIGDRRLDIARHRHIDHENRPPAPGAKRGLHRVLGHQRRGARGTADDDIRLGQFMLQIAQANRVAL